MNFLTHYQFNILLSIDGIKSINDKNRVFASSNGSVYDCIIYKINLLNTHYSFYKNRISINMVVDTTNSFDDIHLIYKVADLNGFRIKGNFIDDFYSNSEVNDSDDFIYKYQYHKFMAYMSLMGRVSSDSVSPIAIEEDNFDC